MTLVIAASASAQKSLGLGPMEPAGAFRDRVGQVITLVCPAIEKFATNVYGTDVYTDSSPICTAAVHAGVLQPARVGVVSIRIIDGAKSFTGSKRNGVVTLGYGSWPYAYSFIPAAEATGSVTWSTAWSNIPQDFVDALRLECPAGGSVKGTIWGTDIYSRDSPICVSAVHSGAISVEKGGVVTVRRAPGGKPFTGSLRNGVESKGWSAQPDAFSVTSGATATLASSAAAAAPMFPSGGTIRGVTPSTTASASGQLSPPPPAATPPPTPPATSPPPPSGSQPTQVIAPRTLVLAGFAGTGSASQPGPIPPRTLALAGFSGVGSAPTGLPVPARTIPLPGWTATGSAP